jgi:7-cyano-7-deazaguanine synthase in queuosine biosynthesis
VFVSGGLDSAILYYLLLLENKRTDSKHEIVPLIVQRKEGSKNFAKLVVAHVNSYFNLPHDNSLYVGNNTLAEEEQVKSGVMEAYALGFDRVYVGLIQQLPQHMVGWEPIPYQQSDRFKTPFKDFNKSHIVDLVRQYNQQGLYFLTHSCSAHELGRCNNCNGCNERTWGFDQLGITDPGTI